MWLILEMLLWLDVALLGLAYVGYPVILSVVASLRPRPTVAGGGVTGPVTLVVSLHDEATVIDEKIGNALALEGAPPPMILLADDGSQDGSEEVCRRAAEAHPGRIAHVRVGRGGKNRALNRALEDVREGIVVFSDANPMYEPDALTRIVEPLRDPRVGCVVGQLRFHAGGRTLEGAYWRYEDLVKRKESACGSMVVGNGAILAVRRGLVPELLPGLANDLQIPLAVARAGFRTVFHPGAVALEYLSDSNEEEFDRKVRMAIRGLSHVGEMIRLAPGVLKLQFFLHKILRWLTGVALLEILALTVALVLARGGIYLWLLGAQGLFYGAALLGRVSERAGVRIPATRFPLYFVVMHLAGLQATWRVLRGDRVETWESPLSTRRPGRDGGTGLR
ncbi:MAG: glycosyltransferase [Pseudomonadota bacterium]